MPARGATIEPERCLFNPAPTGVAFAGRRCAMDVSCPQCGYTLCGIPERRCPECGFGYDHAGIRNLVLSEYSQVDSVNRWIIVVA
jgi:hypothetical protein